MSSSVCDCPGISHKAMSLLAPDSLYIAITGFLGVRECLHVGYCLSVPISGRIYKLYSIKSFTLSPSSSLRLAQPYAAQPPPLWPSLLDVPLQFGIGGHLHGRNDDHPSTHSPSQTSCLHILLRPAFWCCKCVWPFYG
jgi:hypothetical protein